MLSSKGPSTCPRGALLPTAASQARCYQSLDEPGGPADFQPSLFALLVFDLQVRKLQEALSEAFQSLGLCLSLCSVPSWSFPLHLLVSQEVAEESMNCRQ